MVKACRSRPILCIWAWAACTGLLKTIVAEAFSVLHSLILNTMLLALVVLLSVMHALAADVRGSIASTDATGCKAALFARIARRADVLARIYSAGTASISRFERGLGWRQQWSSAYQP